MNMDKTIMLLAGAHGSRAVNRRALGAETGRPRASGGLCRAWGSVLFCKACLPASQAQDHGPRGRSRCVATRTDSSAYGYEPLADFAQPVQTSKISCAIQTACPIYAYRPRQTKQLYIRCLKSLLRLRSAETARVTSRYIEIYEEW